MKEIILNVPDHKVNFVMELIEQLGLEIQQETEIPDEQQKEVNRRLELVDSGEMSTRNWNEAKKEIFNK